MARKEKAAPADGASTAGALQAAWPFPRKLPAETVEEPADDQQAVDTAGTKETAVDRVRVESIDLYTDPANNVVQRVSVHQLFESPFNPRTRYDTKALEELADTIRGVGVMQPILVRPFDMPELTHNGHRVPAYEVVFGHRRLRAAKLAEVEDVPAIVRQLTDAQSAQLQAIENVQRKDLDAIDEAEGYAHYLKVHGISKDQLAAEIGLSRSHVYSRLKLLNGVAAVREACKAGEIDAEVALLLSRIHSPKLQEKALACLSSNNHEIEDGGKRSFRRIREFLRERFTLKLSEALFDTKDAGLVPLAGSCTDCTKRSGNALEYGDVAGTHETSWGRDTAGLPNLCTDPDCFEAKKKQHLRNKAQALQDKGKTVIEGGKARSAIGADGQVKGAYISLKDLKAQLQGKGGKKGKPAALPELQTVIIQNPRDGKTVEAVAIADATTAGVKVKEQPRGADRFDHEGDRKRRQEEEAKAEAKAAALTKVNCAILVAVRDAAAAVPRSAFDLQMVAQVTFAGVDHREREMLAELHGFKSVEQLQKRIGQMTVEQLTALMLDCALVDKVKVSHWRLDTKPTRLLDAAKHYGVDAVAIRKDIDERAADVRTEDLFKPTRAAGPDTDADPAGDQDGTESTANDLAEA
jgi:ParB/RepB/Spo0J family partition protein